MPLDLPFIADWQAVCENRRLLIDENLRRSNQKRRTFDYQPGQQVLKRRPGILRKLGGPRFDGPFEIVSVHVNGNATIRLSPSITERVNIRRLKPYRLRYGTLSQESTHGAETSANARTGSRRSRNGQGNGSAANHASSRPAPAGRGTTSGGSHAAVDTGSQNNQPPRSSLNTARGGTRTQGPGQSNSTPRGTGQPNGGGENAGPTLDQIKPQSYTREQIETDDPKLQDWTSADERLRETYGDTIHHNDGTHLTGTVDPEDDASHVAGTLPANDRWQPTAL
ncbi:hypothetical protein THAOC_27917 [Thalassiosira oceanica]|uniref:Integrase zinc-binding domain-containing protein n=1 Tax=Thalassiosira oceanica TaxID=159749 RepID=K0S1N0_THAOC|nr:hypothetical protein THAOC_27917 [Thalassiosira oceanica]|eukprot:EJK52777.1 hypothetical protein THAOC_27917 [Thalassiosira oceanica]